MSQNDKLLEKINNELFLSELENNEFKFELKNKIIKMKEQQWKKIALPGLSFYEISNEGKIRKRLLKTAVSTFLNENNDKCIILNHSKRIKKIFLVETLLFKTFKIKDIQTNDTPRILSLAKHHQFSGNEWDYGQDENECHWKKIRNCLLGNRMLNIDRPILIRSKYGIMRKINTDPNLKSGISYEI